MKWYFLLFFFIMFILIVASYFLFRDTSETNETIDPTIRFLNKANTIDLLTADSDGYYNTFNKNDLKVRNLNDKKDYAPIIKHSACNGSQTAKSKIKKAIQTICKKLDSKKLETIHGIYIYDLLNSPWNIAFVCDKKYEFGFPHTRNEVIVLQISRVLNEDMNGLCKLLVHEKVHVYQKSHKKEMDQYFADNGFQIIGEKKMTDKDKPANPDIDSNIYDHLETKFKYYAKYRKNPTSVKDIVYSHNDAKYEHPLEKIAYDMENIL